MCRLRSRLRDLKHSTRTLIQHLAIQSRQAPAMTMPLQFAIGTRKAFANGYAFPYTQQTIGGETIYVCSKGSDFARADEFLVLRYDAGIWTAWDSVIEGTETLRCRQPVFRCDEDITAPGWHTWSTNYAASRAGDGSAVNWAGKLPAETQATWRKTGWSREAYLRYEEKQRIRAGMENAARRYDVAEDYADSSDSSAYSRDCIRALNDLADERRAEQEAQNTNAREGYR